MGTHGFSPSRPDGTVCVFQRASQLSGDDLLCGYPAGHPIHAAPAAPEVVEISPYANIEADLREIRRILDRIGEALKRANS